MSRAAKPWRDRSGDQRSKGSMAQFARELLSLNPKGWTREELKAAMRAQPAFWPQFERNPGAYYGMIHRLIGRGEIEVRGRLLFASDETRLAVLARKELFELSRDELGAGGR